ncbi:hypothetical protein [Sphingopyxis sp.]|nr:hypothetical protein [Sphingopyxis sp.]MBK6413849.1 hypothetical protein [Sphingopyxis sp.]
MIIATDAFSGGKMRSSSVIESGMIRAAGQPLQHARPDQHAKRAGQAA